MESHYLLNIAKATGQTRVYDGAQHPVYSHFAAVRLPQMRAHEAEAIATAETFAARFPAPDFKLSLTYWEGRGYGVAFNGDENTRAEKAAKMEAASYDMQTLDIARD